MNFNQSSEYLRETHGLDPRFAVYAFERVDKATILRGRIVDVLFKSGPRKGKPNWKACKEGEATFVLPDADAEAWLLAREKERGICMDCDGRGEVFARWNKADGTTWKPCKRCAERGANG